MNDSEAGTSGSAMEDFDVFLNHRGPDVKATFVAHLEDALRFAGFRPFLDARSLLKSNPALESIDQALAMAKVHVAVVSPRYAESKYCLKELVAIMRSGKPVVPVFYDVEPVDLRWVENGPFAEAFAKHKVRGRSARKVQEWRDALGALAGLTGFRLTEYQSDEARLKREVVNEVARLTPSNQPVEVDECRVGLEGPIHACIELLEKMGDGVGLLGLVGMGGVGKTTLAREIYNHYAATSKFKFMSFLEIRRDSLTSDVQVRPIHHGSLQEQLLWDLLRVQDNGSSYSTLFLKVSMLGPVFIMIDDVHSLRQFQGLIPSFEVLSPGSRIIITSRDQSIVNNFIDKVSDHSIYRMFEMDGEDASVLFNLHAFHSKDAPEDYRDVAKDIVEACGGLPLALKVMGSSLFDKRLEGDRETIWVEAVDALQQSEDVMGVLRWSYERLMESEKLMFMDITCLFDDHCIEEAFAYWEGCKDSKAYIGLSTPHISLRNLINKNLVATETSGLRRFRVHVLLRELGQKIGMSVKRLFVDDGFMVNQDIAETIGLNLSGCRKRKFKVEDFANLRSLHFLKLPDGCRVNGDFGGMPKKLRVLWWRSMLFESVPKGLSLRLLTSLDFSESTNLASIWTKSNDTIEAFPNLHSLNLRRCTSITRLPNSLGQSSHLQHLDLYECKKLRKLPNSIGQLKALKKLNLWGCSSLKTLPKTIACPNLSRLLLTKCTSITRLPEFLGQYSQLHILRLDDCNNLKMLPNSIGQLKALTHLNIDGCISLKSLPDSIGALSNLKNLDVSGCTSLVEIPTSIKLLSSLQYLSIGHNSKCSIVFEEDQTQAQHLESRVSSQIQSFVQHGANLESLKFLELYKTSLVELPESIGLLTRLKILNMRSCERLECLPNFLGDLKLLIRLELTGCHNLKKLPKTLGALTSMKCLIIRRCWAITKLPRSIGFLSQLEYLRLEHCTSLQKLPSSMRQLQNLEDIEIEDCGSIEAMGALRVLQGLPIWGTTSITQLPASLRQVSHLIVRDKLEPSSRMDHEYTCSSLTWQILSGSYEVLEEDESGVLRVYHGYGPSGVPSLLRCQT